VFLASTTHGGETLVFAATTATIEAFKNHNVIQHNHRLGDQLMSDLKNTISAKGLSDFIGIGRNTDPFTAVVVNEVAVHDRPRECTVNKDSVPRVSDNGIAVDGVLADSPQNQDTIRIKAGAITTDDVASDCV